MKTLLHYLDEKNLTVRQGHQLWHLHKALRAHSEGGVIAHMATEYQANGRVKTLAEGMVLAGSVVTCQRRLNIDPPCRCKFDPGRAAEI